GVQPLQPGELWRADEDAQQRVVWPGHVDAGVELARCRNYGRRLQPAVSSRRPAFDSAGVEASILSSRLVDSAHGKMRPMRSAASRKRQVALLSAAAACLVLTFCPSAFALNPALDISQYAHTSWKVRDRFAKGTISAIAQTPDGYLWLGTEFGLFRF